VLLMKQQQAIIIILATTMWCCCLLIGAADSKFRHKDEIWYNFQQSCQFCRIIRQSRLIFDADRGRLIFDAIAVYAT
jgi:hypothetical protein